MLFIGYKFLHQPLTDRHQPIVRCAWMVVFPACQRQGVPRLRGEKSLVCARSKISGLPLGAPSGHWTTI